MSDAFDREFPPKKDRVGINVCVRGIYYRIPPTGFGGMGRRRGVGRGGGEVVGSACKSSRIVDARR